MQFLLPAIHCEKHATLVADYSCAWDATFVAAGSFLLQAKDQV